MHQPQRLVIPFDVIGSGINGIRRSDRTANTLHGTTATTTTLNLPRLLAVSQRSGPVDRREASIFEGLVHSACFLPSPIL